MEQIKRKVSIVILSYNNVADTLECLNSTEALEGGPYHTYLVDNGSIDNTIEQVRLSYPNVEIIDLEKNIGVPGGFNRGNVKALQDGFEYVFILNNDTVCDPAMIVELFKVAEKDSNFAMVMPRVCYYPPKDRTLNRNDIWSDGGFYRRFPPAILLKDNRKHIDFNIVRKIEYAPACGLLIHKRVFERVGLFDENFFFFYEDWDFSYRVNQAGLNIWVTPSSILWHKVSKSTGKNMNTYWYQMGKSRSIFFRLHYNAFDKIIGKTLFFIRDFLMKPENYKYIKTYLRGLKSGNHHKLTALRDQDSYLNYFKTEN